MSVIGDLKNAGTVERAVARRLRQRLHAYSVDAQAQDDSEQEYELPRLQGVIRASELATWPEDKKPVAVVVSPGTVGEPWKGPDGYYSATFSVSVAVVVGTRDNDSARDVAQIYGSAVRGAMLQSRSLGEGFSMLDWKGESFDDISPDVRRTIFAGLNLFYVDVDRIVSWKEGPLVSDDEWPDPVPGAWPTAEEVTAEVDAIE